MWPNLQFPADFFTFNEEMVNIRLHEMNGIMKIVKSLEESGLLIKGVSQKIKNEAKEQKGGFLRM